MTTSAPPQTSNTGVAASAPRSALVLYAARGFRGFGDGFVIILIPAYLSALGYGAGDIGILASVSLLGTAICTLAVGFFAPRYDLRSLLLGGALLMALSGIAFPIADSNFFILMIVGFVGTMNPSTGDLGVLVPLEHAMLARSAADEERTRTFARYSLIGALSMAAGSLAAAAPELLVRSGIGTLAAFKFMFYAYAALGLASAALYRLLPHAHMGERTSAPLGRSRGTVYKLAALFSVDAFAGGFAVQSLVALWLFQRFDLSLSAASLFFFWTSVLSAFSYPVAAWLARRIGLVNTMVLTHIPSSVFLILAALSPSLVLTLLLLLARAALSQMDVPTRTSYVMAVVTPPERTAAASVTAVPRSLASSLSPALAGALLTGAFSGLPLVICGGLKIVYDVALLLSFRHIKPPEEGP